jgi:hypothetical protein
LAGESDRLLGFGGMKPSCSAHQLAPLKPNRSDDWTTVDTDACDRWLVVHCCSNSAGVKYLREGRIRLRLLPSSRNHMGRVVSERSDGSRV